MDSDFKAAADKAVFSSLYLIITHTPDVFLRRKKKSLNTNKTNKSDVHVHKTHTLFIFMALLALSSLRVAHNFRSDYMKGAIK